MRQIALLLLTFAVAHASVEVTRTSNHELHPSTMEIEVTLPNSNQKALIPLTKTDAFENIPMTVLENGVSRTFSSHQVHHSSHSHYRDIASKSVISVRHVNGKRRITGHVMHEGTSYFLEPVGDAEHRVTKNVEKFNDMAKQIDAKQVLRLQSRKKRQSVSSAKTTNMVEILLLTDHTVWEAFKSIFPNEDTALTELHFYYTHILNGIDTAYRNIGTPSISIRCIGFTIAKTAADATWMPAPGSTDADQAGNILKVMKEYSVGKVGDHIMAFTRIDIKAGTNSAVCGMAFMSGVCTDSRQSINEDQGLQSWGTASHELAHNLGSEHDSDSPGCEVKNKFLMSPQAGTYDLTDIGNSYKFSTCTVDYITKYINSLGSTSCLKTCQGTAFTKLADPKREGCRLSLDQVCKLSFPGSPGKIFLPEDVSKNPALICAKIFCTTGSNSGTTMGGLRAPVGTPCGNQKSCNWKGECFADTLAPSADEACFWGDSWDAATCEGWGNYINYQKENGDAAGSKSNCEQVRAGCCKSLKAACGF